ncbi:myosin-6-like [Montipora foliosa]|uniref:myosin-6-like n=1 Tax=Montipora foliosa TaxID=591990 RepID=UPI0035F2189D
MIPWSALTVLLILLLVENVDVKGNENVSRHLPVIAGSLETAYRAATFGLDSCDPFWIFIYRKKDQLLSELKQYRKIFMWMEKDKHVHIRARINARNDLARSNTTLQRIERTNKKVREEKEEIQKEIDALRLQLLSKENREKEEEPWQWTMVQTFGMTNTLDDKPRRFFQCNSINEGLRRLKHDLVEEEKERKDLEAELAARTEEEKELSDETEALKSKVKELEENLKAMKDEHNKLKNENSLLQSERKEVEDNLDASNGKENELRIENASLKLEREQLEESLDACREEGQRLKSENSALKLERKELEDNLVTSLYKESELNIANASLKLKKKELEEDLNTSRDKESGLRIEIASLKLEKKGLEENLEAGKEKENVLKNTNSSLKSQLSEIAHKLCEGIEMVSSLREELASLNMKLSATASELADKEKEVLKAKLRKCLHCKRQRKQYDDLMAEFQIQDNFFRSQLQRVKFQAEMHWHMANGYKWQSECLRERLSATLKSDSKPP